MNYIIFTVNMDGVEFGNINNNMRYAILTSYFIVITCLILFFTGITGRIILTLSMYLSWTLHVIEYLRRISKK